MFKKTIAMIGLGATLFTSTAVQAEHGGGWATTGKILTGVFIGEALFGRQPAPVVVQQPTVVVQQPVQVVQQPQVIVQQQPVYQLPPPPVYVQQPVIVQPAPMVVQPVAPVYPVIVPCGRPIHHEQHNQPQHHGQFR